MSKKFIYVNSDGLNEESQGAFEESDHISVSTGASDSGKPILLDADGKVDASMIDSNDIDESVLDHNLLNNLTVGDPHTQYVKKAGDIMSGNLDMNGNEVIGLPATPSGATSAISLAYLQAVETGLRPKGNVVVATTANISLSGLQTIDGYTTLVGDRVLVKDQTNQTENGVYIAASGVWTRSLDLDNSPLGEIYNGVFIPVVLNGTVNGDKPFFISSVGTGTDGLHQVGIDNIIWEIFTSPTQLQAGDGIEFIGNIVNADLLASGGLKFVSAELAVEPSDFAGDGLIDVSDNLEIDWATDFTIDAADAKAVRATDLSSTSNGFGASIIGIEDLAGSFVSDNVEDALAELFGFIAENGVIYTVDTGGVSKGDLVYISGTDTVAPYSNLSNAHRGIGVALTTESAASTVKVLANDTVLTGVLTGANPEDPYYWNGSGLTTTIPSGGGSHVWQVGVAKNSTDLHIEVRFIKKNA